MVLITDRYYLIAGADAGREDGYLINPSYLAPAAYRAFAKIDPQHPWGKLATDSYWLLNKFELPPNWLLLDKETGAIKSPAKYIEDKDSGTYGFDAFRTMWRIALDEVWFKTSDAQNYLIKNTAFFTDQWHNQGKFAAIYDLKGKSRVDYATLSTDVAAIATLSQTDPDLAKTIYLKTLEADFNFEAGYWGDKENYYDQNWAWFGTALISNNLPKLLDY